MKRLPLSETGPTFGDSSLEMIWILFVLAVIVGLIIVLLRFLAKRNRGWGTNRSLRSLGGYPLGPNKSMQIVEWNGRIYVLGIGENVSMLDAITEPETVAALLAEYDSAQEGMTPRIPDWLRKLGRQERSTVRSSHPAEEQVNRPSFEETLEKRLSQLAERRRRAEQLLDEPFSEERPDNS